MSNYPKPRTISELLDFCSQKNMPLRTMRFFIGENCPEAKAFGIYQDPDGNFVVYKNKADGSRAIRYKGPDEAYAVNEIYEKLKSETESRRNAYGSSGYHSKVSRSSGVQHRSSGSAVSRFFNIKTFLLCAMILTAIVISYRESKRPSRGYYRNNGNYYYYDSNDWYYYDDGWYYIAAEDLLFDDYDDYYVSNDYADGYTVDDFRNSEYYDGYYERSYDDDYGNNDDYDYYDDDDDYDWDWDYDDWDFGGTDWDTDW